MPALTIDQLASASLSPDDRDALVVLCSAAYDEPFAPYLRVAPSSLDAFDLAALSPSDHAWYARFGWESWQGPLSCLRDGVEEPTPDEALMVLRLPRTPSWLDVRAAIACDWRPGEVW